MHINLSKALEAFINQQVASDMTYSTASEWVKDAIREKIKTNAQYHDKLAALSADIDIAWQQADAAKLRVRSCIVQSG